MRLIQQLVGSTAAVSALLLIAAFSLVMAETGWTQFFFVDLFDFVTSAFGRLFEGQLIFPTSYLIISGVFVLAVLATLSAWLQVCSGRQALAYLDVLIFFPSFIPVYVYGTALGQQDLTDPWVSALLTAIVVTGNGIWWWWHRQFVHALEQIKRDKPSIGIQNLGLSVERYFIYPEYMQVIWRRLPEMLLWVLVNALFLEVALPKLTGGILNDLVLSLGDGRRASQWVGVMSAIGFVALVWLLAKCFSQFMLHCSTRYRSWGLIKPKASVVSDQNGMVVQECVLPVLPLAIATALCLNALQSQSPYWELIFSVVIVGLIAHAGVLFRGIFLQQSVVWNSSRPAWRGKLGLALLGIALVASCSLILERAVNMNWDEPCEPGSLIAPTDIPDSQVDSCEDVSPDDGVDDSWAQDDVGAECNTAGSLSEAESIKNTSDRKCGSDAASSHSIAKIFEGPGTLFLLFAGFLLPSLAMFLILIIAIAAYFFASHYRYKGSGMAWITYRFVSQFFEAMAKIPPYLLLVILIFWLGFQTYLPIVKQIVWVAALLLVLLPTQLLQVSEWIREASEARFLVARRSLGVKALSTFRFLMINRWRHGIVMIAAFSIGLALLMDMSMIWLLQERGSFVYVPPDLVLDARVARNWVEVLDKLDVAAWQKVLAWSLYPALMWLLVHLTMRRKEHLPHG